MPERAARLVHERKMGPLIIVFPDCFTSLGGNQYINSSAIGRYADYLTRELIPFVDGEFRTLASREHRGCFGKSSGGYGSMIHAMQYSRYWGAIANHSGDAYFDYVYGADWPNTLDELAKFRRPKLAAGKRNVARSAKAAGYTGRDDGRIARFLEHVWRKEKLGNPEVFALMNLAMAASYDPDPRAPNGFRVPYNLETGELLPERWRHWLEHDPVNLVARYARNLRTLRGIFIDCGWRDQFRIHYGSRLLSKRLTEHRVAACVRGVRRHALRHRLPHGAESAVPVSRLALARVVPRWSARVFSRDREYWTLDPTSAGVRGLFRDYSTDSFGCQSESPVRYIRVMPTLTGTALATDE